MLNQQLLRSRDNLINSLGNSSQIAKREIKRLLHVQQVILALSFYMNSAFTSDILLYSGVRDQL